MPQNDSDARLVEALREVRRPPAVPHEAMWAAIAPHVEQGVAPTAARGWIWPALVAAAASLLIFVSASRPAVQETPMNAAAVTLGRDVDAQLASLPASTALSLRESLEAMSRAIEGLRVLSAASPDDADLRLMLERLERQRFEALQNALEDIAEADMLAPGGKKVL